MRPVSDRFLSAVRGSHQAVFEARVVVHGQTGVDPTGTVLPVTGGNVQFDVDSDIMGTVELTTSADYYPTRADDLLAPYGNELFVRRGIDYGDGSVEWVSLGYYRINSVDQDDALGSDIRVSGQDRMWRIVKFKILPVSGFSSATTYGTILSSLVPPFKLDFFTSVPAVIEWDDTALRDTAVGRAIQADGDIWTFIDDLIHSIGKIWYWDYRGVLVVKTPPSAVTPVFAVDAGTNGVLVSLGQYVSDSDVYSVVVVTGGSPDTGDPTPPISSAADEDPTSPTFAYGPFGEVHYTVDEPLATTTAQTDALAAQLLAEKKGLPYAVDFSAVPNPALEPYDPVRVSFGDDFSQIHTLRRMVIPLSTAGALDCETRLQSIELE